MQTTIRAFKTRTVSSRELSRRTAELLNEIDEEGHGIVVVRHGRAAASLVPLERKPSGVRKVTVEDREVETLVIPELDDLQRRLLAEMVHRAPERYHPDEWVGKIDEFIRAAVRLEMNGLITRDGAGRRCLTAEGERAAHKITV